MTHRLTRWPVMAGLCLLLVAGTAEEARAIHFGEPVEAEQHPAIGKLLVQQSDGSVNYGTGTLLAPDMVLTVAHVVEGAETPFHIQFVSDGLPGVAVHAVAYRIHPGYYTTRPTNDWPEGSLQANDIALVRLAAPFPLEVPAFRVSAAAPRRGQEVSVVGYGRNEMGQGEYRRRGRLQFLRERDGFYVFRSPLDQFQRVDHGDSGGPLFVETAEGTRDIIALVQGGDPMLSAERGLAADEYAYFVSFAAHVDWFTRRWQELQTVVISPEEELHFVARDSPAPPQPAVSFTTMATLFEANIPAARAQQMIATRGMCDPLPADVARKWVDAWLPNEKIRRVSVKKAVQSAKAEATDTKE